MLVLTRRSGESIHLGDNIEIVILSKFGKDVKVGIRAPKEILILRNEIYEKLHPSETKISKGD